MKLPQTLYVKSCKDGGTEYFTAHEDAESLVELDDTVEIGIYELTRTTKAKGVAEFSGSRKSK